MKQMKLLLSTIILSVFVIACGGSDDATQATGSSAVALGQFGKDTSLTVETSEVLELTMSSEGLSPRNFDIKVGQGYVLKVTNNTTRPRFIIAYRHGINQVVPPGETITTAPFSDQEVGYVEQGREQSRGSKPEWQFTITVVE
tara:strand:+ start:2680 stop:3108 length:429 start_codon:yes stop_codon:yes gene_type:complete